MSLIARPRVNSADTDTTDTDDGDAMVSAGDFWPAISLHEIRLASRIPGGQQQPVCYMQQRKRSPM
ncbi:putative phage head completion protein L [Escherichia coli]|uniref:Putative phage head completion protein L n=1 Tax=Escherichia coli TaxID=562 RepID=A0A376DFB8_ECOLX|nr:putative phage head completion protein L [Escherichia coli]